MTTTGTILIVDDDESYAECNADLLEALGYEVHLAPDGTLGLDAALRIKPDVMILDLMMKTETEGLDVARKIRDIPELRNMGVLLVTGSLFTLQKEGLNEPYEQSLPADAVLEKPVPPQRLIEEVQRVLVKKTGDHNR